MRMFIQNSAAPSTWGERDAWLCDLAVALKAKGHEVYCGGKAHSRFLQECKKRHLTTYPMEVKSDISMVTISRFRQLFKRLGIEGVLANLGKDVRLAGAGARLAGDAVVIARHAVPAIKNNWRYQLTYRNLVDAIITPNPVIAETYRQYEWLASIPIEVVPEGIQSAMYQNGHFRKESILGKYKIPQAYPVIAMYGELIKYKQPDIFIDVAREVLQEWPGAAFWMIGDGPQRPELQHYAFELGILDHFYFISQFEQPEELFYASDVVVFTSLTEGITASVLKAMAMGKSVVAFNNSGLETLIHHEDNGLLIPLNDIYAMSQQLRRLLSRPQLMEQLGQRARQSVQHTYDFQSSVAQIEQLFLELYRRKAGGEYGTQNPRFSG